MPQTPKKPTSLEATTPKIPGVPPPQTRKKIAATPAEQSAWMRQPPYVWAAAGAAVLLLLVSIVWWMRGSANAVQPAPITAVSSPQAKPAPATAQDFPTAPGKVATTAELAQIWASKKFYLRDSGTKSTFAMVVHLPGDAYWAFSLREPFGSCQLDLITDLDKLRTEYNVTATHPMVGDPCTHTVYDLMTYSSGPNGLVRGAIVAGPSVRPPFAIELQMKGGDIIATRSE
ncbi:MAG TPA: hypothetical protein VGT03_13865 [Candidatus Acidoferrales bacterium]|nr:hypothetical protein [Candidatus Acidoferrales bacterium]